MRTLAAFLFFLVAAVRGAIEVEDGVLVLTDANFDEAIEVLQFLSHFDLTPV